MLLSTNLSFAFGLFMFCGALVHCHLNVYLNLHEVMRLIGECAPNFPIRICATKCANACKRFSNKISSVKFILNKTLRIIVT